MSIKLPSVLHWGQTGKPSVSRSIVRRLNASIFSNSSSVNAFESSDGFSSSMYMSQLLHLLMYVAFSMYVLHKLAHVSVAKLYTIKRKNKGLNRYTFLSEESGWWSLHFLSTLLVRDSLTVLKVVLLVRRVSTQMHVCCMCSP